MLTVMLPAAFCDFPVSAGATTSSSLGFFPSGLPLSLAFSVVTSVVVSELSLG